MTSPSMASIVMLASSNTIFNSEIGKILYANVGVLGNEDQDLFLVLESLARPRCRQ